MGKDWQHAFVASFPNTEQDEVEYARMVADHLEIDATIKEIDPIEVIEELDHYLYLFEELYITSPIPFVLTYGAIKSAGISVTLDGHGADEICAGYPFDYIVALRDARWDMGKAVEISTAYYESMPKDSVRYAKLPSKPTFIAQMHFSLVLRRMAHMRSFRKSKDRKHRQWKKLDHLSRQLYMSTHETILPTLLRNYDRYSMANGVEIRMPFLDHRLVSYAFSLPWQSKLRNGFSKAIIRDAVRPFLPETVVNRKTKIGFNSPTAEWIRGPLKEYFLDILESRSFKECSLIDSTKTALAIKGVIESPEVDYTDGERVWKLMMPYLWERSFVKHTFGKK